MITLRWQGQVHDFDGFRVVAFGEDKEGLWVQFQSNEHRRFPFRPVRRTQTIYAPFAVIPRRPLEVATTHPEWGG